MRRGSATEQEVRVVYNPASGGAAGHTAKDLRRELRDLRPELVVTGDKGDAYEAARSWRRGLIVAAGGDGTVNEVVNGLGGAGFPEGVTLAVLLLGTGNDLAATLGIPARPKEAVPALLQGIIRKLDAARLRSEEGESFFANVAAGGLGAEVSAAADDKKTKRRWGRVSYLRASLAALRDRTARWSRIELDGTRHDLEALNVTLGNCRYAGGWPAAPGPTPRTVCSTSSSSRTEARPTCSCWRRGPWPAATTPGPVASSPLVRGACGWNRSRILASTRTGSS